jgi:hypothetical protein
MKTKEWVILIILMIVIAAIVAYVTGSITGYAVTNVNKVLKYTIYEGTSKNFLLNHNKYKVGVLGISDKTAKISVNEVLKTVSEGNSYLFGSLKVLVSKVYFSTSTWRKSYATFTFEQVIPSPDLCIDSDGGLNYNVKGKVTDAKGAINEDYCLPVAANIGEYTAVKEGYCDINGEYRFQVIDCPNGCSDGACRGGEGSRAVDACAYTSQQVKNKLTELKTYEQNSNKLTVLKEGEPIGINQHVVINNDRTGKVLQFVDMDIQGLSTDYVTLVDAITGYDYKRAIGTTGCAQVSIGEGTYYISANSTRVIITWGAKASCNNVGEAFDTFYCTSTTPTEVTYQGVLDMIRDKIYIKELSLELPANSTSFSLYGECNSTRDIVLSGNCRIHAQKPIDNQENFAGGFNAPYDKPYRYSCGMLPTAQGSNDEIHKTSGKQYLQIQLICLKGDI